MKFILTPYQIAPDQIIQSHTVLRQLGKEYFDKPVLILGGELDAARKVAEGFMILNHGLVHYHC
jgi:ribonucleotide monophosphatase NagD (HAD superfamily)